MKTEFFICLIAAAGLHAGLALVGSSSSSIAREQAAIEVGLEDGAAGAGSGTQVAPEHPSPEPPPPPIEPAPRKVAETPPAPSPSPSATADASADQAPPAGKPAAAPARPNPNVAVPGRFQRTPTRAKSGGGGFGGTISAVRYRDRAALSYPVSALRQRSGGLVILLVDVDETGRASGVTIRVSSGRADLDAAAIACARQSTYEPYRVNGLARPCRVEAPFRFDAGPGR